MSAEFLLDHRLEQESDLLLLWPLCMVRMRNDRRFPWLILVPRRAAVSEPMDLAALEQAVLWQECLRASRALLSATGAEKMNIGLLGNIVPQLHIHVVARFSRDAAWPGPVWGYGERVPYAPAARVDAGAGLRAALESVVG